MLFLSINSYAVNSDSLITKLRGALVFEQIELHLSADGKLLSEIIVDQHVAEGAYEYLEYIHIDALLGRHPDMILLNRNKILPEERSESKNLFINETPSVAKIKACESWLSKNALFLTELFKDEDQLLIKIDPLVWEYSK